MLHRFRRFCLLLPVLIATASAKPAEVIELEPVWSGHPVGFSLVTHPPFQFVAYFDAERRMTVAQRRLDSKEWSFHRLSSQLGWDSHNYVTLAIDPAGHLHVSGNMHCVPLVYFRSEKPLDAASLKPVKSMTGDREARVTYPMFLRDAAKRMIFRYRDGGSGKGDDLYNVYDPATKSWTRLIDGPVLCGEGERSAYATAPVAAPDGSFHMVWVWRDTPDCATNHTISYARSSDLMTWTDAAGKPLALPITMATGDVVDPVPSGGGLININREVGFDNKGRAVVTYHKYDERGDLNAYAARHEGGAWKVVKVSDWTDHRVEFGGGGSIVFPVRIGAVEAIGDGRLKLAYRREGGGGTWVLDEETLLPVPGAKPPPAVAPLPREFTKLRSTFPGMGVRKAGDSGSPPEGVRYRLVWETLEANRDKPRTPPLPEASMLRLVEW
jgi:hypothetical protein